MEIKKDEIIRKTIVKFDGAIYLRTENSQSIFWEENDKLLFKFSYETGKWYENSHTSWVPCNQPKIEIEFGRVLIL